jgi:hypothetical protein
LTEQALYYPYFKKELAQNEQVGLQGSARCSATLLSLPAAISILPLYLAFQKQVGKHVGSWQGENRRQEASQQV